MSKHGFEQMHQTITFTDGIEARSHLKKVCKSMILHDQFLAEAETRFMTYTVSNENPQQTDNSQNP